MCERGGSEVERAPSETGSLDPLVYVHVASLRPCKQHDVPVGRPLRLSGRRGRRVGDVEAGRLRA